MDGPLTNDVISYTYDELGRVKQRQINGAANTATTTYDVVVYGDVTFSDVTVSLAVTLPSTFDALTLSPGVDVRCGASRLDFLHPSCALCASTRRSSPSSASSRTPSGAACATSTPTPTAPRTSKA